MKRLDFIEELAEAIYYGEPIGGLKAKFGISMKDADVKALSSENTVEEIYENLKDIVTIR